MVRIENPVAGKRAEIGPGAAEDMIRNGTAVAACRVNGLLALIRLTGPARNEKEVTGREYDAVSRSFHGNAIHIPVIAAEKMIREEKSSRDWSYQQAVRRMRRMDTAEEVAAIRRGNHAER